MRKMQLTVALLIVAFVVASVGFIAFTNLNKTQTNPSTVKQYTYTINHTYPHDTSAYTEGLVYNNGSLYESTGGYGTSTLRKVNLEDGTVQQEISLPSQYFGEGLTAVNNTLIQLTWQEHVGFVYDKSTFNLIRNFSVSTEGWGLTFDGKQLIMSDGSDKLYFLNPTLLQTVDTVNVHDGNTTINNLNELEYVNGNVYANIWLQQKIVIIDPYTGTVKGWVDMSGLYDTNNPSGNPDNVLNGIAYDAANNRLFVTGKDWPNLYQITLTQNSNNSAFRFCCLEETGKRSVPT